VDRQRAGHEGSILHAAIAGRLDHSIRRSGHAPSGAGLNPPKDRITAPTLQHQQGVADGSRGLSTVAGGMVGNSYLGITSGLPAIHQIRIVASWEEPAIHVPQATYLTLA
jgi:hypothetical protein